MTQFIELYGAGLKNTADMMSATLQSAQQLQQQQLDLFALQTRLAGAQFEHAVQFWSQIWSARPD
ncbi:MAG TPA: hypothetical protein VNH16_20385 [Burkholderiales bacterium]|jgi:hypothetical protein|nr:hypothetical protein [Burkholderiales bacterium]